MMTSEEAIQHIRDIICENNSIAPNIVIFELEKEALDMAIKALEQQPCEDCVSRADALKEIAKLNSTFVTNPDVIKAIADSLRIVEKLPSVTSYRR